MTSLYVHPRLGEVTLSQTVRARRISISVRATGAVRLSFPCGVPQKRALDFLEQKAEWIGAARERLARKRASLPPQLPPEERKARIEELGMREEDYGFYMDLRKYGSARHAGFGLGFERCVMYLTGIGNIRDAIPFPRTVGNCEL